LFELGDVLIDALFPFLAQRFPDLRWYRMDTRQNGQLLAISSRLKPARCASVM